jgi:hypothetical protein
MIVTTEDDNVQRSLDGEKAGSPEQRRWQPQDGDGAVLAKEDHGDAIINDINDRFGCN